jgi:hypothetical protein
MLYSSDIQGRSIIQILILREWEKDKDTLLEIMGGIVGEYRNEERICQIEQIIESLRQDPNELDSCPQSE